MGFSYHYVNKRSRRFLFFFECFSKVSRKFVEQNRFRSSSVRSGSSGKSRATRCQNFSLLRRLADPEKIEKQQLFADKFDFGHRSGALDRPGSRELRAVKISASYDAWRPQNKTKMKDLCRYHIYYDYHFYSDLWSNPTPRI